MNTFPIPTIDWTALGPVAVVILTGAAALIIEMVRPDRNNNGIVAVSLFGLALAAWLLVPQFQMPPGQSFGDMILRDNLALWLQLLMLGACFVTFLFSEPYLREKRIAFAEFYPLAVWSTAGAMIMVGSSNLLMIFLGLEVMSIAIYCMAGMSRQEEKSEESAFKYFLLGAFSSAFLLYGIAFLYGASGSLDLRAVSMALDAQNAEFRTMAVFGIGLILVGLTFKASLFPFHQWTPDVYQGAPTNVTAFIAVVSKIATIGAVVRVLDAAHLLEQFWMPVLIVMAVATMFVGNLIALRQKDVKRTLGYSSISHAGYLMVAILAHMKAPETVSLNTTVYYLLGYSLMAIGAFAVVTLVARNGEEGTRFQDVNGLWKRAPFAAGCFVLFIASLVAIPPTAGFFGKLFIFQDALAAELPWLAIFLAVNSAISVYYYLGMLVAVFVDSEGARRTTQSRATPGLNLTCLICAAGIVSAVVFLSPLLRAINMPLKQDQLSVSAPGTVSRADGP